MDKMREEFKLWANEVGLSVPVNDLIHYNEWTKLAWQAWQASRSAIAIDLPEPVECFLYESEVIEAINSAGLKVKT